MAFLTNIGYRFKLPETVQPGGSVLLASAMPKHQLERRRIDDRYPHLAHRLFDPQLYLAGLDARASGKHCAYLATYPWFGISGLQSYTSGEHTQSQWRQAVEQRVAALWTGASPTDPDVVRDVVAEAVRFERRLGCDAIILPSPLTVDPSTDYREELLWLDGGLRAVEETDESPVPVYATVALSDICVRYFDPAHNQLLDVILDSISARGVDGVYVVLEQASEPHDTRHCSSARALASVLRLVHVFSEDVGLDVGVNFLGLMGLACEAVGAAWWASGWYKSLYRLRLADRLAGGRAYPSYWSYPCAVDVHLDGDFDAIVKAGFLEAIADQTVASAGLLRAARDGLRSDDVPGWRYAPSNIAAAKEHFLLSAIQAERKYSESRSDRIELIQEWLSSAVGVVGHLAPLLGQPRRTKLDHVDAWRDAFQRFRIDHKL